MTDLDQAYPDVVRLEPGRAGYPASVAAAFGAQAPVLTCRGNGELLQRAGIAFCGSRKASDTGLATARDCADQVAQAGLVAVSGNAAGVDRAAHLAALQAGGLTILVLPEGMDRFRIRRDLKAGWDWSRVLVISQFPADAVWRGDRAMTRNRLIIALSRAMIVIEAGETGGTLNAGLATLESGKPLFVARYRDIADRAPGNARLLEMGGQPLSRSRQTGRASFQRVLDMVEASPPPSASAQQMAML